MSKNCTLIDQLESLLLEQLYKMTYLFKFFFHISIRPIQGSRQVYITKMVATKFHRGTEKVSRYRKECQNRSEADDFKDFSHSDFEQSYPKHDLIFHAEYG